MLMERLCLNCQTTVHGRSDKKFCDDQCRSAYNFEHQDREKDLIKQVNQILKKNRQILLALNPNGKSTPPKSELSERGFNFEYYTNSYEPAEQKRYYYCYD